MITTSETYIYDSIGSEPLDVVQGGECVEIRGLEPGTLYYGKTNVTTDIGIDGSSQFYQFYTLPEALLISAAAQSPTVIKVTVEANTTQVNIAEYGIMYKASTDVDWLTATNTNNTFEIGDLAPNTTYQLQAFVVDEFNRQSISNQTTTVSTPYEPPVIDVTMYPSPSACDALINLQSSVSLSDVYATIMDENGVVVQEVELPQDISQYPYSLYTGGLLVGRNYTLRIDADNGYASSKTVEFTTLTADELFESTNISHETRNNNGCTTTVEFVDRVLNRNYVENAVIKIIVALENGSVVNEYTDTNPSSSFTWLYNAPASLNLKVYGEILFTIADEPNQQTFAVSTDEVPFTTYAIVNFLTHDYTDGMLTIRYNVDGSFNETWFEMSLDGTTWHSIGNHQQSMTCGFMAQAGNLYQIRGRALNQAGISFWSTTRIQL